MPEKNFIDDIKEALAAVKEKPRSKTANDMVLELNDDILSTLEKGESLEDIYEIIREKTPQEIRMSYATFKKYWQQTRRATGLTRKKRSVKRKKETATAETKKPENQIIQTSDATVSFETEVQKTPDAAISDRTQLAQSGLREDPQDY